MVIWRVKCNLDLAMVMNFHLVHLLPRLVGWETLCIILITQCVDCAVLLIFEIRWFDARRLQKYTLHLRAVFV